MAGTSTGPFSQPLAKKIAGLGAALETLQRTHCTDSKASPNDGPTRPTPRKSISNPAQGDSKNDR